MADASPPAAIASPRVVIVGGGFGGINCTIALRKCPVQATLVDRRNFHLFQPLLYQVATGGLSPANIAAPLRWVLRKQQNCEVVLSQVIGFDLEGCRVLTEDGDLPFDYLVVAAGSRHSYFGRDDWEELAPGLKTIEDATAIRRRVYSAFERAEQCQDPVERRCHLNFAIVGGGPTGVELAGALAEIAKHSLRHDFRHINPSEAQISLIEASPRILAAFPPDLSAKAQEALVNLGVLVRTDTRVTAITPQSIELHTTHGDECWPTCTVLWAAGVQASPLARALAAATGALLDRAGRISVAADMSLPGQKNVFVMGDMASYLGADGKPLPGVAPVAIQQGKFVAKLIACRVRGKPEPKFKYFNFGNLATIGKSHAVADFGKVHLSGFVAWIMWLFIHLMKIVNFRNRVLVFMQWGWNYFTNDRSARLITGEVPHEEDVAAVQRLVCPAGIMAAPHGPPPPAPATPRVAPGH